MAKNLPAMWEMPVGSLNRENPLEKSMATHSSILAWRTPRTEESGSYSSWVAELDMTEVISTHAYFNKKEIKGI